MSVVSTFNKLAFNRRDQGKVNSHSPVLDYSKAAREASNQNRSRREYGYFAVPPDLTGIRKVRCGTLIKTYDHDKNLARMFVSKVFQKSDFELKDGKPFIGEGFLKRGHQISAYDASEVDASDLVLDNRVAGLMDKDYEDHASKRLDRDQKHFTLYRAHFDDLPESVRGIIDADTYTETYTGSGFYYVIDGDADGRFNLRVCIPTKREDGSFVQVPINDAGHIRPRKIVESLGKGLTYADATHMMQAHWQGVGNVGAKPKKIGLATKFWEERHDVCSNWVSNLKYKASRLLHFPDENMDLVWKIGLVAGWSVSFGLKDIGLSLLGVATIDATTEKGMERWKSLRRSIRASFGEVADYKRGNCADLNNKGKLDKLCPNIDLRSIDAGANQILNFEQNNAKEDAVIMAEGVDPFGVDLFVWSAGGLGTSSTAELHHGSDIELKRYHNGLVSTKVKVSSEMDVYFSRYRSDVVLDAKQDMLKDYKEQLGDGVRVTWKPKGAMTPEQGVIVREGLTMEDARIEMGLALDALAHRFSPEEKTAFLEAFETNYDAPNYSYLDYMGELDKSNVVYMSYKPSVPPSAAALEI